jgi:hypothetical protein
VTNKSDAELAQWYHYNYTQGVCDFAQAHPSLTSVERRLEDMGGTVILGKCDWNSSFYVSITITNVIERQRQKNLK